MSIKYIFVNSVFLLTLALSSTTAFAEEANIVTITETTVFSAVLLQNIGKTVELTTTSGATITGKLAQVTDKLVYVKELAGKDYFDAVIKKDSINSITFRRSGR